MKQYWTTPVAGVAILAIIGLFSTAHADGLERIVPGSEPLVGLWKLRAWSGRGMWRGIKRTKQLVTLLS